MNNSRGSTLAIAVSMLFLFAALGVGAMDFGGAQNLFWVNQEPNTEAFWLADAGIESAFVSLQNGTSTCGTLSLNTPFNIGKGSYSYNSATGTVPCTVIVTGSVGSAPNLNSRTLLADIENFNSLTHNDAVVYSGTINHSGAVSDGNLANGAVQNVNLDAQDVFGISLSSVEALATKTYTNGQSIPDPLVVSGITVIKTTTALTINDISSTGSGALLIIDTTGATSPEASNFIDLEVNLDSSTVFNGIVYVLGNMFIGKNVDINGAVYDQGNLSFHDSGGGNGGVITGNSGDISGVGTLLSNQLFINSWEECKNTTCT